MKTGKNYKNVLMSKKDAYTGFKEVEKESGPHTSIYCSGKECVELYIHSYTLS
jgi:hypothetical protein